MVDDFSGSKKFHKFHSLNLQPEVEEVEIINIDFMSKTLKK